MHASQLVASFSNAAQSADPMGAAKTVMEGLASDIDAVRTALDYLPGTGGNARQAFFRAPELSLLKVSFPNGRRTPPHNHGTWALILVLCGREKNTLYRRDDSGRLKRVSEVILEPGAILPMRAEAVHVAEGLGSEPALGLHVYGADVLGVSRSMWDPESLEEHPLDWSKYEGFAQRATAAEHAPLAQ